MHADVRGKRVLPFLEADDLDALESRRSRRDSAAEEAERRIVLVDRLRADEELHGSSESERMTGQRPSPPIPSRRIV